MKSGMSEEEIYELAKKRVEEKRGFYIHLSVYIIINIVLVLVWAFPASRGYPWFLWALGGWGIGIISHFLAVFVFNQGWDRSSIEKEAEKIRREQR